MYFLFNRTDFHHTIFDGFYSTLVRSNSVPTSDGTEYTQTYIDWPNVKKKRAGHPSSTKTKDIFSNASTEDLKKPVGLTIANEIDGKTNKPAIR
ncbi:hypothetical protein RV02_GL001964 [Enterococcus gilvus]|nr:hypothetical protein RV02_GL001964 [Enterococcus gilvus]